MKKGIAASKGYAIGRVFIQEHEEIVINDNKILKNALANYYNLVYNTFQTKASKLECECIPNLDAYFFTNKRLV